MLTLYAATSNPGKVAEFQAAALQERRALLVEPLPGLASLPVCSEDGATFAENAQKKAVHYSRSCAGLVFADDSGLEVEALRGAPGVLSARYAGAAGVAGADSLNNEKLLRELGRLAASQRRARFVCVLALAREGRVLGSFEGQVEGIVADAPRGSGGFGYDPLFLLPELDRTFAELTPAEKLRYSHRGRAFRALLAWLSRQQIS